MLIQLPLLIQLSRVAKKLEVSQERVIAELARVGFSDLREVARWDGGGFALAQLLDHG